MQTRSHRGAGAGLRVMVCSIAGFVISTVAVNAEEASRAAQPQLVLTGIADLGHYRRAYVELHKSGEGVARYSLAPSRKQGELELVSLDAPARSVTVRYGGRLMTLTLGARADRNDALTTEEKRDQSHAAHHARRAVIEREEDAKSKD